VFNSRLLPIFLIVVVDVLGFTLILPLLPFFAERLGATPAVVGLLVSSYAFCQLFSGPLLGRVSDRIGRRPLLLLSQAGTFAGFLLLAASRSLWMVFLARIIDGATAGNISLAQAYIADVTAPEERSKSFALIGIAFGLGFLVGPAFSGYLAQFGYLYPVFVAAGLSATSIVATYFLLPMSRPAPAAGEGRRLAILDWGNYVQYFRRPALGRLLGQFFVFIFAFSMFISCFALFAERRFFWHGHPFGPKEVGYVYGYVGLLGVLLQGGLIGRLVKGFGERPLVRIGFVAAAAGFTGLAFSRTLAELLIVAAVTAFGTGILRPVLTSLITQATGKGEQGTVLGLTQSLSSISQIVAPAVGGWMIGVGALSAWGLVMAAATAAGLLLF
jgi:DHA1 family tetracycline resistance protein-like MFS transporter